MSKKPDPEMIDEENPEWTHEIIQQARPASEVVPEIVEARRRGRPVKEGTA